MRTARRISAVAMLATVLLAGSTGYAAQAGAAGSQARVQAAATTPQTTFAACSGYTCDGKDPAVYCNDGVTVASTGVGPAYLELRYSPTCRSVWARISNAGYDPASQLAGWAQIHRNSDGRAYRCSVYSGSTGCYTMMLNDANVTSYAEGWYDSGVREYYSRTTSY